MEPKSFSAKDLCRIIELCAKVGVAKMKFGDVEVEFKSGLPPADSSYGLFVTEDQPKTSSDTLSSSQASEKHPIVEPVDRELLEDMRKSQLLIEDPMGFEQELIDSFLRPEGPLNAQVQN